jgi:hypothetical protein
MVSFLSSFLGRIAINRLSEYEGHSRNSCVEERKITNQSWPRFSPLSSHLRRKPGKLTHRLFSALNMTELACKDPCPNVL